MSGPIRCAQTPDGDGVEAGGAQVICAVCNRSDKLLRCSRCKVVFYCTKEHQRRDWKRHREFCATHPARVASAAPAEQLLSAANNNTAKRNLLPVGSRKSSAPPDVSNLRGSPVSDTPDVTAEPRGDAKHPAGTPRPG